MKFAIIALTVLSLIYIYVQNQLLGSLDLALGSRVLGSLIVALPFLLVIIQPLFLWSRENPKDGPFFLWLKRNLYIAFSYANYWVVLVILRDAADAIHKIFSIEFFKYNLTETVWIFILPIGMYLVGHMFVRFGPTVLYRKLSSEKLTGKWKNFRIVQISDLHLGASNTKGHIQRTVDKVNDLNADVVVFTGDLFDGTERSMREQYEILKTMKAKNFLFCSGNHEYYWPYQKLAKLLDEMNMLWLNNSETEFKKEGAREKISFYGIPDPQAKAYGHDSPDWDKLVSKFDHHEYRILLCHQPYLFDVASEKGFDLQLSGHTHSGQFFPWNFFIHFFQKYVKGFYKKGDSLLYVNQGTAYWGPPDRLGTLCEITCFDID